MLNREIIAVCSEIHAKIKTLCGQNVELYKTQSVPHGKDTPSQL